MGEEKFTNRKIVLSGDGSHTLHLPLLNETYHSRHGAITESMYVFIEKGINLINEDHIKIFEVGFGTGLNAWLTLFEGGNKKITYHTIEAYPIIEEEYIQINYFREKKYDLGEENYLKLHQLSWGHPHQVNDSFSFMKIHQKLEDYNSQSSDYNLIYYDAYGPTYQPDMWEGLHFEKMFQMLQSGGVLVSYCCSGVFKRGLKSAGFQVKKVPGPPGKREMVIATKP